MFNYLFDYCLTTIIEIIIQIMYYAYNCELIVAQGDQAYQAPHQANT